MRFGLKTLLWITTGVALVIGSIAAYRVYPYQAVGANVHVANRVLWDDLRLPPSASDVTFYVDRYGCEAEFAISESEFLKWCRHRGWHTSEIAAPVPYFQPVCLPDDNRPVEDGYLFEIPDGRGVYDRSRSRAAYWASIFP
ncbi:hypothetical protein [Aeoliella sp.]|uniref:hypothetical protein n=1 Tax=Aeoliella sp. TaxID=2795800 RepID=UPI003CCBF54D